jgi:Putative Flp pilus-assembly TadE/G-like
MKTQLKSDRGAVIIHVAFALLVLIAFSSFVIDAGILAVSRAEAQNSADAGAIAGATALAFDNFNDRSDTGPAKQSAFQMALRNDVWLQNPGINITTDVTFPDAAPASPICIPAAAGALSPCVRVDVYRNQARGNPLPTYFARLFGVTDQGVLATATAVAATANAADCLKPWAVADKWLERRPVNPGVWSSGWDGNPPSNFDRYNIQGQNVTLLPGDVDSYTPPTQYSPGTGFTVDNDYGMKISLKVGTQSDKSFSSGWFLALDIPEEGGGSPGAAGYKRNIKGCNPTVFQIGDTLTLNNEPGDKVGPTRQAVSTDSDSLVNSDPTAWWDPTINGGRGGVRDSAYAISPRIVPVPVIDIDAYIQGIPQGKQTVQVVNILGFFVQGMGNPAQGESNKDVIGYLTSYPGLRFGGGPPVGTTSSFLRTVILIR